MAGSAGNFCSMFHCFTAGTITTTRVRSMVLKVIFFSMLVWCTCDNMTVLQGDRVCVVTASLHHCITASLHHCITASLHRCITASLYRCITAWLHRYINTSLHYCISTSVSAHWFCRFGCKSLGAITASLHYCIAAWLHHCITASLH